MLGSLCHHLVDTNVLLDLILVGGILLNMNVTVTFLTVPSRPNSDLNRCNQWHDCEIG